MCLHPDLIHLNKQAGEWDARRHTGWIVRSPVLTPTLTALPKTATCSRFTKHLTLRKQILRHPLCAKVSLSHSTMRRACATWDGRPTGHPVVARCVWTHRPDDVTGRASEVPGRAPFRAASRAVPGLPAALVVGRVLVPGLAKPVTGRPPPVMGRTAWLGPPW